MGFLISNGRTPEQKESRIRVYGRDFEWKSQGILLNLSVVGMEGVVMPGSWERDTVGGGILFLFRSKEKERRRIRTGQTVSVSRTCSVFGPDHADI
jgi:hypothetical protein